MERVGREPIPVEDFDVYCIVVVTDHICEDGTAQYSVPEVESVHLDPSSALEAFASKPRTSMRACPESFKYLRTTRYLETCSGSTLFDG